MSYRKWIMVAAVSLIIVGCRGADETDISDPQFPLTNDPDAFNEFLNQTPAVPRDGVVAGEIDNVQDFPVAYYNTIDPDNTRDTFRKWRIENGFINEDGSEAACNPANCRQTNVRFRDTKDLGYGRNMFMRWNTQTNDVAVYVENFQVDAVPGVPYGPLNFEALVSGDRTWNFGVNAIEFSSFPDTAFNASKFTKFYNFAGDGIRATLPSGDQQHFVDLDNRGEKPMPTTCIVCHGGRGRTLVYRDANSVLKLAPTLIDGIAGDVMAQMQIIEFDTLQFADEPGFTRDENEQGIQLINEAILATYRQRDAEFNGDGDWSAAQAIELLEGRYSGDPGNLANRYNGDFVPADWQSDQDLYRSLVGPNCIVCHALRGTNVNTSGAFPTRTGFDTYAQRIDHLIYEQGKMPLGLLNYSDFWDSDDKDPATLANALSLADERFDADQRAIRPGAPVAVISAPAVATGVDAATGSGLDIAITGSGSAFAASGGHRWSVEPAATATVEAAGPNGDAVLRVSTAATYTLTLSVDGVHGGTDSATQTVRVVSTSDTDARLPGDAVSFFGSGGIQELFETVGCVDCHAPGQGFTSMPIYFTPCSSDEINGNEFLYRSVLARVNFDSPLDSLILRKPSNGSTDQVNRESSQIRDTSFQADAYHAGGYRLSSDADYGLLLSWILNGAPSGSIPGANTVPGGQSCI
ncbi:MAG: hypothetical protein AB8B79_00720 [Granulosicoccus sp.]